MLPIFQKKFVQELRDFSATSGEGCRSVGIERSFAELTEGQVSPWPCGGNEVRQSRPFSESRALFLVAAASRCERCRLV
jgi:hypothetical protein